jgi:hypothetical protein
VYRERMFETVKSLNREKIETAALLIEYFKNLGHNKFQAPELAETHINAFIDFVNTEINQSALFGEVCLFSTSNKNLTSINLQYFFVQEILHELYNGISDREFEMVCANVLKHSLGVENASVTSKSGDGGYDFYGSFLLKTIAGNYTVTELEVYGQSKQFGGNISRPEIDKFQGFIQNNTLTRHYKPTMYIFAATSDFSTEARQRANKFGITCWRGMQIASFIFQAIGTHTTAIDTVRKFSAF